MSAKRWWLLLAAILCLAAAPASAAPKKAGAKAMPFAEAFAKQQALLAPIDNCKAFVDQLPTLAPSNGLLNRLSGGAVPAKSEFETSAGYAARRSASYRATIGDPDKIYIRAKIPEEMVSYNADGNLLSVDMSNIISLPLGYAGVHKYKVPSSNSYGVKRVVTMTTGREFEADIFWLPGKPPVFDVAMSPTEAFLFKSGLGQIHILGRIIRTSELNDDSEPATVSDPTAFHFRQLSLSLQARCVAVSMGSKILAGSEADQWDAP